MNNNMQFLENNNFRLSIIGGVSVLTLGIHYGWVLEPIFGDAHWIHAVHGRFCYIPIVIASAWYGLRGGLYTAALISLLILPLILSSGVGPHDFAAEVVEIVFYFGIALLSGGLTERELSSRKKQEDMRLQLEKSKQLSRVGQIAAGVAHEIKNPLASIKGAVEILADEKAASEEKEEFRQILFSEIKRMDGTITEFLAFARPPQPKLEMLNLSDTIRASIRQLETHASREGINLFQDILDEIYIKGDRLKMHEMALNILLNALQVSKSGETIKITLEEIKGKFAHLVFEDSGPGINEADLENVYEPFFTTKSNGTGLGLAIVKSIVESHDGQIDIFSTPGRGTRVEITLPLLQETGI
ncbi:MAG: ATP-binding protein [candidate division Zixibacteria bacterium]